MKEDLILRDAVSRYDAALEEARKLAAFIQTYGELKKGLGMRLLANTPHRVERFDREFLVEHPRAPVRATASRARLSAPANC